MVRSAQTAPAAHSAVSSEPVDLMSPNASDLDYDFLSSPGSQRRTDDDDEIVWSMPSLNSMSSSLYTDPATSALGSISNVEDEAGGSDGNESTDDEIAPVFSNGSLSTEFELIRGDCGSKTYEPRNTAKKDLAAGSVPSSSRSAANAQVVADCLDNSVDALGSELSMLTLDSTGKTQMPSVGNYRAVVRTKAGEATQNIETANVVPAPDSVPVHRKKNEESGVLPKGSVINGRPKRSRRSKKQGKGHSLTSQQASIAHQNGGASAPRLTANGHSVPNGSPKKDKVPDMAYEAAVKLMDEFLENPDQFKSKELRLDVMQALIIELGLVSTSCLGKGQKMPKSVTAAQKLLKTKAFINVRDYLAVRKQGLEALRKVMQPSRNALIRDVRKRKVNLGLVKRSGLDVLLVDCHHS